VKRLASALFVLAERLGAQVYSENRRPYLNVADWEKRQVRGERNNRGVQTERRRSNQGWPGAMPRRHNDWLPFVALLLTIALMMAHFAFSE
jgi:hypothetical protein